jgi:hypothetical protein
MSISHSPYEKLFFLAIPFLDHWPCVHSWVQIGQIHTRLFSPSTEISKQTSYCLWFHSFVLWIHLSAELNLLSWYFTYSLYIERRWLCSHTQCRTLWSSSPEIPTTSSSRISFWFVEDLKDLTFTWVFIITCYRFRYSRYLTASQLSTFNIHWYTRILHVYPACRNLSKCGVFEIDPSCS